jgi:Pentapeptide repeats (8 copies)
MSRQKFGLEAAAYLLSEYKTGKRRFSTKQEEDGQVHIMALDLAGMDLHNSRLKWAVLTGSRLFRVNFTGACLGRAELDHTNLQEANLSNADLSYANLCGADLTDANLQCANLCNALLIDANLTGADLRGAKFEGTDLTGAILLDAKLPEHIAHLVKSDRPIETETLIRNTLPDVTIEMLASIQ